MEDVRILLDAPGEPTSRMQVAMLGDFDSGKYGQFSITRDDVEQWQANLDHLPGKRALIDLDHQADRTPRRTEAAGWITNIGWEGDTPMAEVEWTPVGEQAIKDKRYLFFSPTYGEHKNERGEVFENTLLGGALTNRPFLGGMPAITLASEERLQAVLEDKPAAKLLELSEETSRLLDELSSKARKNLPDDGPSGADSRPPMSQALLKTLGLAEDADEQTMLDAITALQSTADKAAKLERKLEKNPVKTLEQQAKESGLVLLDAKDVRELQANALAGAEAQKQLHAQAFETAFEKALHDPRGPRVKPAEKDRLQHFYELDADGTLALIDERDPIVSAQPRGAAAIQLDTDEPVDARRAAEAGLHAGSLQLEQDIRKHMREQNLPNSTESYMKVLEQWASGALTL